jgi:general secretion pathway protein D
VRDTPVEELLRFVLVTNQLEKRVLNENTLLIYPHTPQKLQQHKELVVRSFYLENADARQTANLVRTRDLFVDEKLNLLVIRDTPQAVRIVEKLIAAHDLPEPAPAPAETPAPGQPPAPTKPAPPEPKPAPPAAGQSPSLLPPTRP